MLFNATKHTRRFLHILHTMPLAWQSMKKETETCLAKHVTQSLTLPVKHHNDIKPLSLGNGLYSTSLWIKEQ